jgi:hypothetical protein
MERLRNQRDLYKYVHDQTVRMMNQGLAPAEISEALTAPPGLENDWSTRGYYGTLSHDAKAVYQRYLGWFDGNPGNLNPIPPVESAKKYVEYMGGASLVIAHAREDFKVFIIAGWHKSWIKSSMPIPRTARPERWRPRLSSNSAISRNPRRGEMHICWERRNCAMGRPRHAVRRVSHPTCCMRCGSILSSITWEHA